MNNVITYRGQKIERLDHGTELPPTWRVLGGCTGGQFTTVELAKRSIDSEINRDAYERATGL